MRALWVARRRTCFELPLPVISRPTFSEFPLQASLQYASSPSIAFHPLQHLTLTMLLSNRII
ncbi:hypothetical protein B0H14DRAFT_3451942 [Mycena olivaceomarginata]|nr:hypothetical protein B0H14DRAFT_3451942 [Mycena olivaceomarginata]